MFSAIFSSGERVKEQLSLAIAGIITASFSLIILGTFVLVYQNIVHLSKSIFQQTNYSIFLEKNVTSNERDLVLIYLNQIQGIKNIRLIPPDELREELLSDYQKTREILDDAIGSILPEVIDFSMNQALILSQGQRIEIELLKGIDELVSGRETQEQISIFFNILNFVGIFLILIMIISVYFIISNSIQISIRVRLKEIKILKTLGATDGFIRNPFIVEGVIISMISYFIALGSVYFLYLFILAGITFNEVTYQIKEFARFFDLFQLSGTFLIISCTGMIASVFATNRIIKHLQL